MHKYAARKLDTTDLVNVFAHQFEHLLIASRLYVIV